MGAVALLEGLSQIGCWRKVQRKRHTTLRTVLIIEDHPLYRTAIEQSLSEGDLHVLSVDSLDAGVQALAQEKDVDVALLDLQMPGVIGFEGIEKLRETKPDVKIVILSAHQSDELVSKAIHIGADSYLSKSLGADELKSALNAIIEGERVLPEGVKLQKHHQLENMDMETAVKRLATLTPQQSVILSELCDGKLNKQIAFDLDISETTVKAHITAILRKLGVVNRTQAVLLVQSVRVNEEGAPFEGANS